MPRLNASMNRPRIFANLRESFVSIRGYSWAVSAALLTVLAVAGCGGSSGGSSNLDSMAEKLNQQAIVDAQAAKDKAAADAQAAADAKAAEAARLANQGATEVNPEDMQRGSKMTRGGYLQTVLKGGIRAEQKLNLYSVDHALNLYNASNGHYPRSHEEFMKEIIEFNGIVLEPLQEPYEYWYNAEDGQLYKVVKQEAVDQANADTEAAQAEADNAAEAAKP